MCMDDVRIGRATTTTTRVVTLSDTVWTQIAAQSVDRYSILSWITQGDGVVYYCGAQGAPDPLFLPTSGMNEVLLLDLQHHGDMVTQPWYGLAPSGSAIVHVVETNLRKQ